MCNEKSEKQKACKIEENDKIESLLHLINWEATVGLLQVLMSEK